uniref:Odorant receptor n=1 Tax=Eogystia hippophaecolus TaxID=1206364 RepID=A0A1B3P5Q1_EOGHI|nr:odorant receptor [Eogystia hippophaecolus]
MFYFTEIVVTTKVFMVLGFRSKLLDIMNHLDCEEFKATDENSRKIIDKHVYYYKTYWKIFSTLSHLSYFFLVLLPIIIAKLMGTNLELPICKYYFFDDKLRNRYFYYLFIYQSIGMYAQMTYNVNADTLMSGLILMAVTQLKVLNYKLSNLKVTAEHSKLSLEIQDNIQYQKLNDWLKHHYLITTFCTKIQNLINVTMLIQFGMSAATICVSLCGFLMMSSTGTLMFVSSYLFVMIVEIFVPAWMGTQLSYESRESVFAIYDSEWIPRSEKFKRNMRLFVECTNVPIILRGVKMFPLSLETFTSIMKTAYSFFTLIRNVQDRENGRIS